MAGPIRRKKKPAAKPKESDNSDVMVAVENGVNCILANQAKTIKILTAYDKKLNLVVNQLGALLKIASVMYEDTLGSEEESYDEPDLPASQVEPAPCVQKISPSPVVADPKRSLGSTFARLKKSKT